MKGNRHRPGRRMPFRNPSATGKRIGMTATLRAFLILIVGMSVIGGALVFTVAGRGLSAHDEPSGFEAVVAWTMRRLATPEEIRTRRNPVPLTDDVVGKAFEHYADH